MNHSHCERQSKCKFLPTIFHVLLVTTILKIKFSAVNAASAVGEDAATGVVLSTGNEEKRNWQALQGPWGKRAHYTGPTLPEANNEQEDDERLVPLLISNGERDEPFLKYSMMYLTNAGTLDRLLNEKQEEQSGLRFNDELPTSIEDNEGFITNNNNNGDNDLLNEKRAWNKMNTAWGKRRNTPTWNKFRGAWGKREPGWNNLKGMWGKRSSKDWVKLHGGWGKRALN
ncbi:allatostatins MIP-like [Anastrepha obliqua]|uniref:allatostatins MIP-like n=1 Tax=Anastrepha obliqua TaxID=95512 RepID=UPI00240A35C6|nr:allatostatins MIP-like [Anastrepha obliqua]XP_054733459.1 allatostatins MIP-like [Anastrepha obliqua]